MAEIVVTDEVVSIADRAYWDKFGTQEVVAVEDGDVESLISMRAALEAAAPLLQVQVDREALRGKLDQLWGWAKAGKQKDPHDASVEYYLMDTENVDAFTHHVLALLSPEETK